MLKQRRSGKTKDALLRHHRCPHCEYDLAGLPADPRDDATVCPECRCASRLGAPDAPADESAAA